jgi:hypothetical protein
MIATPSPFSASTSSGQLMELKSRLLGRFSREGGHEYPCCLTRISDHSAVIEAPVVPPIGGSIWACFEQLGGLGGNVTGISDNGSFTVEFNIERNKRNRFSRRVAALLDPTGLDAAETPPVCQEKGEPVNPANASGRMIEIELRSGRRLRAAEDIDPLTLARLVSALDD